MKDKKVVFMGTPEFAVPILEMLIENTDVVLVVTQPDKAFGRNKELRYSSIKEVALKSNIEVFQPLKIRDDYERIISANADIIVTCAYGQIIPKELLNCFEYGAINVHASLLPFFRGGAPIHRAIIEGFKETGVTIMYMDEFMDQGDIISQRSTVINNDDNVGTLHDRLSVLGKELLFDTLPLIFNKINDRIKQDNSLATYASIIKREDERLDFSKSALEVYNKIRGLYPFPTSYMVLDNEEIKVLDAFIGEKTSKEYGCITSLYKNGIGIGCNDKEIVITRLKPFGKKEMNASDYINGKSKDYLLGRKVNGK